MENLNQESPYLDRGKLWRASLFINRTSAHWAFYNTYLGADPSIEDAWILKSTKAEHQINNIIKIFDQLHMRLKDFVEGNFARWEQKHKEDEDFIELITAKEEFNRSPFDPYNDLTYILYQGDKYIHIPDDISLYKELVSVLSDSIERMNYLEEFHDKKIMLLENLKEYCSSRENLTDFLEDIEDDISVTECLDNYNEWILSLKRKIYNRANFIEILMLFKRDE